MQPAVEVTLTARGSVGVDATFSRPLPLALTAHASIGVDGAFNQLLPIRIASAATVGSAVSGAFNRPLPIAIVARTSVRVDGAFNQRVPIGILARASGTRIASFNQSLPILITARGIGPLAQVVPNPTILDVLSHPSVVDLTWQAAGLTVVSLPGGVDVTAQPSGFTVLSSESDQMPNLVHYMVVGDTSPALLATLGTQNTDGSITPDDLSGCTVSVTVKLGKTTLVNAGACSVLDAINGKVQYSWSGSDISKIGSANMQFRSVDGGGKIKHYPDTGTYGTVAISAAL